MRIGAVIARPSYPVPAAPVPLVVPWVGPQYVLRKEFTLRPVALRHEPEGDRSSPSPVQRGRSPCH